MMLSPHIQKNMWMPNHAAESGGGGGGQQHQRRGCGDRRQWWGTREVVAVETRALLWD